MLRNTKDVGNYSLGATDGVIGPVQGMLIDEDTWAIRCIVVNTSNWWLGHQVLIAPPYDSTAELNRERESGLYQHYGHPGSWTDAPVIPESGH
jgi:hypothetical protein